MDYPETVHVTIQATYKNLQIIGEHVRSFCAEVAAAEKSPALNLSETELSAIAFDVELAVHEVCNNIIDHAYGHENGQIAITLCYAPRTKQLHIDVQDTGPPFDASTVVPPNLEQPQTGGYGLFLANQLVDEVTYTRVENSNIWHLTKQLRDCD